MTFDSSKKRHEESDAPLETEMAPSDAGPPSSSRPRKPRGFAAMDRKLVSQIASKGGKAAHKAGTAHEFTSDEARAAGKKGGAHAKAKSESAPPPSAERSEADVGDERAPPAPSDPGDREG